MSQKQLALGIILVSILVTSCLAIVPAQAAGSDGNTVDVAGEDSDFTGSADNMTIGTNTITLDGFSESGQSASIDYIDDSTSYDGSRSLDFTPKKDLNSVSLEFRNNGGPVNSVSLIDESGSTVDTTSVGSTAELSGNIVAGETYTIEVELDGFVNFVGTQPPIENDDIKIEDYDDVHEIEQLTPKISGTYETASYTSGEFDVDKAEDAYVDLNVESMEAIVEWQANDNGEWVTVGSETTTSPGNVTTDLSGAEYDKWRLKTSFDKEGDPDDWNGEINSYGIRFTSAQPKISSASPKDGVEITDGSVELSIDINDSDFDTAQSDTVTIDFFESDGAEISSQSASSNGTVTSDIDTIAGENEWYVVAKDSYDNEVQSETYKFTTPEELEVRNESDPDSLVTDEGDVEVRFFGQDSGEVITRTTTDGIVDLSGLPADEPLIASVNIDGYFQRTIAIDSILDQQRLFLLPDSKDASQVDWVLNDESGQFPATDSTLFVERPIEIDGETEYRVVVGERFGATKRFASQLATDDRYRLRIINEDGDSRVLGGYVAAGPAEERLTVGSIGFPGVEDEGVAFSAQLDEDDQSVDVRFRDPRERTDQLSFNITKDGEVVYNSTQTGPISTSREDIALEDLNHTEGDSYEIQFEAERGGEIVTSERIVGDIPEIASDWGIDERLLSLFGYLTIIAVFGAVVILSPRHAGIVGSSVAAGLTLIGIVPINQVLLGFAFVVSGLFAVGGGR